MKRAVHIAYVCADRGVPVGGHKGASLHVRELVTALIGCGAEVDVLAARVAESGSARLPHANVIDVGGSRSARQVRAGLATQEGRSLSAAAAAEAAAVLMNQDVLRSLEKLHRARPIHAVYERYSLWSSAAASFARAHEIPYLLEVNAPLCDEQKRYRQLENEPLARALEHHLFASADRVLVPSAALVPHVTKHGAVRRHVEIVANAADPSRFHPKRRRKTKPVPRAEFVVGFLGSLKPWHGLDDLAVAFRRLHRRWKGYRLLVVGDGPLREDLERRLGGLESAVTFTGAAGHDEVPQWTARMDVALAPYPKGAPTYFSPIKIFEYMASGTPIVASRVGQIDELLAHRRTALLHEPGAVADIVDCVEELRSKPLLAAKLSSAARTLVVRKFTWKRNAQRVLTLLRTVEREHAASKKRTGAEPVKR